MKRNRLKSQKSGKSIRKTGKKITFRKNRIIFLAALAALLIVLVSGIRYISSFQALQNKESWATELREAPKELGTNYLLMGVSGDNEEYSVKEMLLLNYPEPGQSPHIIFIPGSILMHHQEGHADEEIEESERENGMPANGTLEEPDGDLTADRPVQSFYTPTQFYNEGGTELLITRLSQFLGADIHHYIKVNYEGIPDLVDERGGIPYYGYVLEGSDFLESFLREEDDEEPYQRAMRRAGTINNLVEFLGEKRGVFATPGMLREAAPFVETDLEWKEMGPFYEKISPVLESQSMVLNLPGQWRDFNGDYYYEPDSSQLATMMENLGSEFMIPREMITVEVLNGSGVSGIAGRTGEFLREEGFKVVNVDNADHQDYQRSHVISRIDDIEAARKIALHIPGAEFFKEPVQDYPAMVTVIIGKNFDL